MSAPMPDDLTWYICVRCGARQSKHEKYPRCAYCEAGRIQPDTPAERRLAEIAKLEANWDSYGALPIDRRAIEAARRVMRVMSHAPQIVPTVNSGIQLEWHRDGLEVEIAIDEDGAVVEFFSEDAALPVEGEP